MCHWALLFGQLHLDHQLLINIALDLDRKSLAGLYTENGVSARSVALRSWHREIGHSTRLAAWATLFLGTGTNVYDGECSSLDLIYLTIRCSGKSAPPQCQHNAMWRNPSQPSYSARSWGLRNANDYPFLDCIDNLHAACQHSMYEHRCQRTWSCNRLTVKLPIFRDKNCHWNIQVCIIDIGWHTHQITLTRHSRTTEACWTVVLEDGHWRWPSNMFIMAIPFIVLQLSDGFIRIPASHEKLVIMRHDRLNVTRC